MRMYGRANTGERMDIGGIVGRIHEKGEVLNCYMADVGAEISQGWSRNIWVLGVGGVTSNTGFPVVSIRFNRYHISRNFHLSHGFHSGYSNYKYYFPNGTFNLEGNARWQDSDVIDDPQKAANDMNNGRSPLVWKVGSPFPEIIPKPTLGKVNYTAKIGDNTKGLINVVESKDITVFEVYNQTTNKSLYKGPVKNQIAIDLPEGINNILFRAYDQNNHLLESFDVVARIEKRNILSKLWEIGSTEKVVTVLITGTWYIENNAANRTIVNQINQQQGGTFFIGNPYEVVFSLLKN